MSVDQPKRPLDGTALVEATDVETFGGERLAIALAGRIAADLGATVLKIEPPDGDPLRRLPPLIGQTGAVFAFLNAGKRSVVPADDGVLGRLIRRSAGLIADPVTNAQWGQDVGRDLPAETARARVSVSLLGAASSRSRPASEFTVMALGGILDVVGDPDREPLRLGGHQAAYSAGLAAYAGLAAALCAPESAAGGPTPIRSVQVSLLETAVWLNWKSLATAATGGTVPSRSGQAADWPMVRCQDGWVALVYLDADWPGIRRLAGHDVRLADPVLATAAGRRGRNAEIAAVVEDHVGALTRREIRDLALRERLPLGPVAEVDEIAADPHVLARGFLRSVGVEDGSTTMPRLPLLWNGHSFPPGDVPALPPSEKAA